MLVSKSLLGLEESLLCVCNLFLCSCKIRIRFRRGFPIDLGLADGSIGLSLLSLDFLGHLADFGLRLGNFLLRLLDGHLLLLDLLQLGVEFSMLRLELARLL